MKNLNYKKISADEPDPQTPPPTMPGPETDQDAPPNPWL